MPFNINDIFALIGLFIRAVGFLVIGFAVGRFVLDNYAKSVWQVQIALALGFFGLLVGITDFASAGSTGAFAFGAGAAYFMNVAPQKTKDVDDSKK